MLTPDVQAELLEIRTRIDRLLSQREPAPSVSRRDEPKWMRPIDYARARSMSPRTLRDYYALGLPSKGTGKMRRIPVAEADAWLEKRGA